MDVPFHLTIMGRRFIEGTVPQVSDSIHTLNSRIAAMTQQMQQMDATMRRLAEAIEKIEGDTRPQDKRTETEEISGR